MVRLVKINKENKVFKRISKESIYNVFLDDFFSFEMYDFILYKEIKKNKETGKTVLFKIVKIKKKNEHKIKYTLEKVNVPVSFFDYCSLSYKEEFVFKEILNHIYLYGLNQRDTANTFWSILDELINNKDLDESDMKWYRDLWYDIELENEKKHSI